ncbi:hypothetical protein [Bradyrhizobium sp. JR3.5]
MAIANLRELKRVVSSQETAPVHDVAKAIGIKLRLADQNENDAANHRREAGEMLVTLRKRVEADNQSWKQFVYDYFDRPRAELEKLMTHVSKSAVAKAAIEATPRKSDRAIAAETGVGKDTVRRARDQLAQTAPVERRVGKDGKARRMPGYEQRVTAEPQKSAPSKRIVLLSDEPCADCNTQQERWHRSLSNMAGEAISLPAYWTQQFDKDWQTFDVPADVLTLAKQAAEAWNDIVESLINRKKGNTWEPPPVEPDRRALS